MVEPKSREERVSKAAYRRYLARVDGGGEGDADDDWLEAVKEINAEDEA